MDRIRSGVMLIEDGTRMPEFMAVGTEHYAAGWSDITGFTSAQLGGEIERAGWTFFFMAGEIHARGFGANDQSRTAHAILHLIDDVKLQNCNCLEITRMRRQSILGLPYVSVFAHARHIQKSRSFFDLSRKPVRAGFPAPDWLYDRNLSGKDQVTPANQIPKRSVANVE